MALLILNISCQSEIQDKDERIRMIIDSDANNELDDQHAIAYALFMVIYLMWKD